MEGSCLAGWMGATFPNLAAGAEANERRRAHVAGRVWRIGNVALDVATGTAVKLSQPDRVAMLLDARTARAAEWVLGAAREEGAR